ncbi:hypothetical protein EYM_04170 [Ignicoccus islandicus DSM 13165]|uniref:Uncharacterized protein n=1 Tax=Ignicoccus islandicus DSM 13165 TaxID=940295 RepID=A0A0U3F9Y2_9CREN|nr:hypothetical protein [Ignicoccus islandicus]ALU12473.1 hypothetical protein EYM_04170 [Ignicoccus islandicus DSM 13165]
MEGSARLELHLSVPLNLVEFSKVLAKYGLWSAKVLPKEDGTYEILSMENLLIGYKPSEDLQSIAYKIYVTPDAKNIILFGDIDNFKDYVAELISFLTEINYSEDQIDMSTLIANVPIENLNLNLGLLRTDFLGELIVNGLVATSEGKVIAVSPMGSYHLLTVTLSGEWREVRPKVMVLQPLISEVVEVLRKWTSQK